jgi:hypothetical protein
MSTHSQEEEITLEFNLLENMAWTEEDLRRLKLIK